MTRAQRKRHLFIWIALAALLPAGLLAAIRARGVGASDAPAPAQTPSNAPGVAP